MPDFIPTTLGTAELEHQQGYGLFTATNSCKFMKDICVTMAIAAVMRPDPI